MSKVKTSSKENKNSIEGKGPYELYTLDRMKRLDENSFRRNVLEPLLRNMGYEVHSTHGASEFGKDFIICNRDLAGEWVYTAVITKVSDITGKSVGKSTILEVISQAKLAFSIPFKDITGPTRRHVERVWVVTTGNITEQAKEIMMSHVKDGGPIRFYDGYRLEMLCKEYLSRSQSEQAETYGTHAAEVHKVHTGCGILDVTIVHDGGKVQELMVHIGKAGGCASSQMETISHVVTCALKYGVPPEEIVREMKGISCNMPVWNREGKILSCADGVGKALESTLKKYSRPESLHI